MGMTKEEVVMLMSDTVDEFNRQSAMHNSYPLDQIEEFIAQGRQQMEYVNGILYDVLKENGVISEYN
jgi:hypothetical protein